MSMPRLLQLSLLLVAFSLAFVCYWYLDAQENKLSLISGHGTALRRCPSQPENKFSSTYDYGGSRNDGPEAPNQDLEGVEATGHMRLELQDLQRRQYARKKLIHDMCRHKRTLPFMKKATISDIPNDQLSNLIVDDRHGIIYCYVPKVACTEWKSIMIFLSESLKVNGTPYQNHSDIPRDLIHGNSITYLNRVRRTVMKWKIQKYKKFLFVRNPFVRLISAYRDKFEKENSYFYKFLAVPIMRRYSKLFPPASAEQAHKAGIRPSFSDFIRYILDLPEYDGSAFEEHWRQVYHLCHPCQIEYDFIGKMETMNEDARHLLHLLDVDHIVHFPPGTGNRTEESWITTWFSSIPVEWRRKLYKLYQPDFELFGYSLPDNFYENATPTQSTLEVRRKG